MQYLIDYAKSFLGIPYVWGGNNPFEGWDCSGFVQWILMAAGVDPRGDQTAQMLRDHFVKNAFGEPLDSVQPGALVFYGQSKDEIVHVAFALDNNWVIEAGGGSKKINENPKGYLKNGACTRLRRHDYRSDVVSILLPKYNKKWGSL